MTLAAHHMTKGEGLCSPSFLVIYIDVPVTWEASSPTTTPFSV